MNCHDFENRLDDFTADRLAGSLRREAEAHLAACGRCRDLLSMIREGVGALSPEAPTGLTAGVLSRTSGSVCPSAHDRLPGWVDGTLDTIDAELVDLHVQGCRDCGSLARTLVRLAEDLPAMAEVEPDPAFVRDVVMATAARRSRRARWRDALGERWTTLVQRPRFAFELAYVGAMFLWLLFGTSFSPLRDVPGRALALTRFDPSPIVHASIVPIPQFIKDPAGAGRRFWTTATREVLEETEPARRTWHEKLMTIGRYSRSFGAHGIRMVGEAFDGNYEKSAAHLKEMGSDLKSIWRIIWTAQKEDRRSRAEGGHHGTA